MTKTATKPITVFLDNKELFSFETYQEYNTWRRSMAVGDYGTYSKVYVLDRRRSQNQEDEWFRADGLPALLSDVPKELRTLVLLLT